MPSSDPSDPSHSPLDAAAPTIPSTAAASPTRATAIDDGPRPGLWYLDLLLRPTRFFTRWVEAPPLAVVVAAAWVMGLSLAIDRVDRALLKADLSGRTSSMYDALATSWTTYWLWVVVMGALGGALHYVLGGWWYRVRLRWAGAHDPEIGLARRVYCFASLVDSVPFILITVWQAMVYASPIDAYNGDDSVFAVALLAAVWAIVVSYKGARACFDVRPWGARVWFLILPLVLSALVYSAIVAAFLFGGVG